MDAEDLAGPTDLSDQAEDAGGEGIVYHWKAGTLQVHDAPLEAADTKIKPIYGASVGLASSDPQRVIGELRRGLPFAAFDQLQEKLGITARTLAAVVGIADRTLTRRRKEGRLQTDESDRLFRIGSLYDRAVEVLGSEEAARTWLKTSRSALGDRSPLDSADTEPGAREVEDLLGRIQHGVFS